MTDAEVRPQWLGRVGYRWAWRLQSLRRESVIKAVAPEAVWLLEHDPVITTGRRQVPELSVAGLEVVRTERGGLATWHGPGQLVCYLILDIRRRGKTVRGTIEGVEQAVIDYLDTLGLEAGRRCGFPGVWCGPDKLCAVGLHVRRGVSMHGFALNLTPDLSAFSLFTPCGIRDGGVTSVARELGEAPALGDER